MNRTSARLVDFALALALLLALAGAARLHAAEWPNVRESDTLWPGAPLDNPQWPNVSASELAKVPTVPASEPAKDTASAPAASPASQPAPAAASAPTSDDNLTTGASLDVPPLKALPPAPAKFDWRFPPEFTFEGGARYWYSIGQNRFAFTNGFPLAGNPTSTLDWDRMQGHTGEVFGRIDHKPTHLFIKGLIGGGVLKGGDMDDLDFLVTQINFSNTTSAVDGNGVQYGIVDLGYSFEVPSEGIRYGAFVGYHYWRERMTAFGVLCNGDAINNQFCGPAGATVVSFGTPVDVFDTTWNAIRVGADVRYRIFERWTISGDFAFVPYAWLNNDDSHLLRTDLGPVPNIRTRSMSGMGGEVDAFLNYQVVPHFQIGVGARYWNIFTTRGSVDFGPTFVPDYALTKFSTQRYGVLFEAKATF